MSNPLDYPERVLGVHKVFEEAEDAMNSLSETLEALDKVQAKRRSIVDKIADRETDIHSEEWSKHPDMAASRMDQHVRIAKRKDENLTELRNQLSAIQNEAGTLEFTSESLKHVVKLKCARLNELGGYLNLLAAIKTEKTKKP